MVTEQWSVEGLTLCFGSQEVLSDLAFPLDPGQVLAVVGGDGAGKTSLCRVLAGLVAPSQGRLVLPAAVGYQPAGSGTWGDLTVEENLRFMADAHSLSAAAYQSRRDRVLAATGLLGAADRLASRLSGGMRQKLGVAMALLPEPQLLVLDEPTSGVDPVSRSELWTLISETAANGTAVVMTTTYVDEADRTGHVLILDEGRMMGGGIAADTRSVFTRLPTMPSRVTRSSNRSPLVAASGVTKAFGNFTAVDEMSLQVYEGEVVGLLGGNGAGKTTLIRCLLGLVRPDSGSVLVLGVPPNRDVLRQVGYMPQGLGLYSDLSITENLDFRRRIYGKATETPELKENATPVGQLPLGVQRRAAFAATLSHSPRLLVLDEPTSGVGPMGRAELWVTIREAVDAGAGALVTTHHLEEAEHCDRLVMMAGGREVASGSVDDVIGKRTAFIVHNGDRDGAYRALTAAGLSVAFEGDHLRLSNTDLDTVSRTLANAHLESTAKEVPATLEETFVALAR